MGILSGLELATILTVVSIMAVWLRSPFVWCICYCITLVVGFFTMAFGPWSLLSICALSALLWGYSRQDKFAIPSIFGILVLGLLLGLHLLPGFNNHQYLADFRLSDQSAPLSIWFNYDKSLFGILVLGAVFHRSLIRSWKGLMQMIKQLMPILCWGLPLVYGIGMLFGYAEFDWTPSLVFLPWALKNIFFTVLAEEMMFRGLIQTELAKRLPYRYADNLSVFIAGLLFGVAHFAGGLSYVFLSTIAGCVYGYAYKVTARIEAPIIMHFLLNAVHFLFLSYPFQEVAI